MGEGDLHNEIYQFIHHCHLAKGDLWSCKTQTSMNTFIKK